MRPTLLPLPATQVEPLTHWLLAVQTPSALAHGHCVVHARSGAVLQTGLSVHTTSLVEVPAMVWFWLAEQTVHAWQVAEFCAVENLPVAQAVHTLLLVALPLVAEKPAAQLVHASHVLTLLALVNVPLGQASQTRSLVADAAVLMRVPGLHVLRAVQLRSRSVVGDCDSYSLALHLVQTEQSVALTWVLNVPELHAAHCRSVVAVGTAVCLLPGWHAVSVSHFRSETEVAGVDSNCLELQTVSATHWPLASYFPAPQLEQTRLDVEVGATLSLSPDPHTAQGVHDAAFTTPLKAPAGHGLQARSACAVGWLETNVPAPQTVSGLQTRSLSLLGGDCSYSASPHCVARAQTRS